MTPEIEISFHCALTSEARCHCGQLVAILKKNGVELKCKRCKRLVLIPFSPLDPNDEAGLSMMRPPANKTSRILTNDHT